MCPVARIGARSLVIARQLPRRSPTSTSLWDVQLHCHVADRLTIHQHFQCKVPICVFDVFQHLNMSGAEAAGLAVGVIALASLFNTCVELLEYFELGKNHRYDYNLACTKVNLLHKRLSIWGTSTHIRDPDNRHPVLQRSAERDTISKSLHALKAILADTDGLRRKYDLSPVTRATLNTPSKDQSRRFSHWSLQLRRRTTWSIRDKAKFDRFIEDISFFIENLESVTSRDSILSNMTPRPILNQRDVNRPGYPQSTPDIGDSEPHSQQSLIPRPQPGGVVAGRSEGAPHMTSTFPPNGASNTAGGTMTGASTGRSHSTGGVYTETDSNEQRNTNSLFSFQGAVYGREGGVHVVRNSSQVNNGGAGGFQGAGSLEAALQLQQQANDYYMKNAGHRNQSTS